MSDSTGTVVFGFEHEKTDSNPMVKFSGIKIRSCKAEVSSESCEKNKTIFRFNAQHKNFQKTDTPKHEVNGVKDQFIYFDT